MTAPDWATPSQRAAGARGAARARADCAVDPPTVTSVTLDAGAGARTHIAWCLLCQTPTARCTCANTDEALVEDPIDVEADVAALIASSREQLQLHAAAVVGIEDVAVAGERL